MNCCGDQSKEDQPQEAKEERPQKASLFMGLMGVAFTFVLLYVFLKLSS